MQKPPIEHDVPNECRDTEQTARASGNEIGREQSRQRRRGLTAPESLRQQALVRGEPVRRVQSARMQD
jgi:hypothetical protein